MLPPFLEHSERAIGLAVFHADQSILLVVFPRAELQNSDGRRDASLGLLQLGQTFAEVD